MNTTAYFKNIREDSDRAIKNCFMFQNPWDMEMTSFPYYFRDKIDWNAQPKEDPEWTFMLSRHGFIANLAKAEYYFHEKKYGDKAISLIEDFIINNPLSDSNTAISWRSLDAGIRVTNWIDALEILKKCRGEEQLTPTIEKGIREHIAYLKTFDSTFLRLSNWGAIGNAGLFKASCYLNDKDGIKLAHTLFLQTITNQVLPDGFQWEQSSMYQAEVLLHTLDFIITAKKYNIKIEDEIIALSRKMALSFVGMMKPDRKQFMQSDSDSTELIDIIAKSAFALSDENLKWACGGHLDLDYSILAQQEEIAAFKSINPKPLEYTTASYYISGNIYLRNNWSEKGSVVHLKSGSYGGGHGHGDSLHVDASLDGEDVLIDSGRFTYVDSPLRRELKRPSRHNTIIVDGKECFIPKDSWAYEKTARALSLPTITRGDWSFAEGLLLGYMEEGVLLSRKVLLLDDILVLLDKIEGQGVHILTRPLHLAEKGKAQKEADCFSFKDFKIFSSDAIKKEEKTVSFHYNELDKTDVLIQEAETGSKNMLYTVIGKNIKSVKKVPVTIHKKGDLLPSSFIQALSIELNDKDPITILYKVSNDVDGVYLFEAGSINGSTGSLVVQQGQRREMFRG